MSARGRTTATATHTKVAKGATKVTRFAWGLPVGVLTVALTFVVVGTSAQQQEPPRTQPLPRFRAGASLVRVDAYPTLAGKPVTDLTAADFEVLEDGAPQKVEGFEFVQVRAGGSSETRREPNTVREAAAMAEDARARIFVIYLDTYFTDIPGSHRIQRSLVNLLNRIVSDDDLFAVMTPDMSARDLALARRAVTLEGYLSKYWFWGQRGRLYPDDPVEQRYLECYPENQPGRKCSVPGQTQQVKEPDNFYDGIAKEMIQRRREKRVLDGLADLSRHLGGLRDERKAVIAISNGWLLYRPNRALMRSNLCEPPPGRGQIGTTPDGRITTDRMRSDYGFSRYDCDADRQTLANLDNWDTYQELMDIANRNNVAFYPVDARGLAAFDRDLSESPVLAPHVEQNLVQARVESLQTLAENTDGLAVVNTNNLDKGFQRIVDDMTSYYLLGYYSTNTKMDGKVRRIAVKVRRSGVDVRARRSYRAPTEEEIEQGRLEMTAAAASAPMSAVQAALNSIGSSRPGVPLRTAVSYAPLGGGGAGRAHVWALAELDATLLRGAEWLAGGEVDVLLAAADGTKIDQRVAPLAGGQRSISVDLGEIALPAGELVVRTRIRPAAGGLPVSDTIRLSVTPDAGAPGVPLVLRRGPTTGTRYVPTADRQFRRTERVRIELPVTPGVQATSGELLDRSGKAINVPVTTAVRTEGALTWATAEVTLAPLAVGDYALRLKTEGGGKSGEVVTGFRVVP
jgi:VWFA-related protein